MVAMIHDKINGQFHTDKLTSNNSSINRHLLSHTHTSHYILRIYIELASHYVMHIMYMYISHYHRGRVTIRPPVVSVTFLL